MKTNNIWYSYYGLNTEPNFKIEALTKAKDLNLFVGRKKAITALRDWLPTKSFTRVLITGEAGTGKTSLVCRAYNNVDGFIRIDIAKVPAYHLAPSFIAKILLDKCQQSKCSGAKKLRQSYEYAIHITEGRQIAAGGGPLPGKLESVYHKTHTPLIAPDHVYNIINKSIELLHKKFGLVILLFDEADPDLLEGATRTNVLASIRVFEMPEPSMLIWPVRNAEIIKKWESLSSLERQLFDWHEHISPLGDKDAPDAAEILYKRLKHVGTRDCSKIISEDAVEATAILATGNIREYIRFCREILQNGFRDQIKLPISQKYAILTILKHHKYLALSDDEYKLLRYLKRKHASASEKLFQKAMRIKRSALQERLNTLKAKNLVEIDERARGKHVYRPSKKGVILLSVK